MVMSFSNDKVRKQLLEKGLVYTFRIKKRHTEGKDWANDGRCKPKICDITVKFVKDVSSINDLIPYAGDSGFLHAWDWVCAIFKLNPKLKRIRGFLYEVRKI